MRHLRSLSTALAVAGIAALILAPLAGLDPTWTLVGLLLAVAGVVKLVVVFLWRDLNAGPGLDDRSAPTPD